jgi:hypothetical protein
MEVRALAQHFWEGPEPLERIEAKLDLLLAYLGLSAPTAPGEPSIAVQTFLRTGDRMMAIRAYRQENGVSLQEARGAVESLVESGKYTTHD